MAFHGIRRLIFDSGDKVEGKRVTRGDVHGTITGGYANDNTMWIWKCAISWDSAPDATPEIMSVHAAEKLVVENEKYKEFYKEDLDRVKRALGKRKKKKRGSVGEPMAYTGKRVAKMLDDVVYLGTVKKYKTPY